MNKNNWAYWYDFINEKKREDKQFYMDLVNESDLALEIGCGTGRVYFDMIENGYNVHGLDLSEEMLEILRSKADEKDIKLGKLYNQNVMTMDINNSYDLIYYPFNSITHVNGGVNNQLKTFENIRSHLNSSGKFAFDIFVLDFDVIEDYNNVKYKYFEHNNTKYKFETWAEIDSQVEQTIKSKNRIINLDKNKIEWDKDHKLTLYPKQQLELLLRSSGFSEYNFYHNFTDEDLKENSEIMSIVAKY